MRTSKGRVRCQVTLAPDVIELLEQEAIKLSSSKSMVIDILVRKALKSDE